MKICVILLVRWLTFIISFLKKSHLKSIGYTGCLILKQVGFVICRESQILKSLLVNLPFRIFQGWRNKKKVHFMEENKDYSVKKEMIIALDYWATLRRIKGISNCNSINFLLEQKSEGRIWEVYDMKSVLAIFVTLLGWFVFVLSFWFIYLSR